MSTPPIELEIIPLERPRKGVFYSIVPGIQHYEINHRSLSSANIDHWFVANLEPDFEHSFFQSSLSTQWRECPVCGDDLEWEVILAEAHLLSDHPLEISPVENLCCFTDEGHEIMLRHPRSSEWNFTRVKLMEGSSWIPTDGLPKNPFLGYGWSSRFWMRNAIRYKPKACIQCGDYTDLQCRNCGGLLSHCPKCGTSRKFGGRRGIELDWVLLRDWQGCDCVMLGNTLLVTGELLLWLLRQGFFGFTFSEVTVEEKGASEEQIRMADQRSVPLEQILPYVPGGAENNAKLRII